MTATSTHEATVADVFSEASKSNGRAKRARRAEVAGRQDPPRRDPTRYEVSPTAKTVQLLEAILDADPRLLSLARHALDSARAWRDSVNPKGPQARGRRSELELRTALFAYLLLADAGPNFHVINLPGLLGELPADVRRRLGVDRLVKVPNTGLGGTDADYVEGQVTYRQLLTCLHNLADSLDPNHDDLDDTERTRRAQLQQQMMLCFADAPRKAMLGSWVLDGSTALDATMKPAWERPPHRQGKVDRYGSDGDAGPPPSTDELRDIDALVDEPPDMSLLSNMVGDGDLEDFGFDPFDDSTPPAELPSSTPRIPGVSRAERRKLGRAYRRSGATLMGRKGKEVYGYALHTTVNGGPGPCVITHAALTPATAHPAASVLPLLRDLYDARSADPAVAAEPSARPMGDVSADGAYSATLGFVLGVRAMGGSPVFRLHPTKQEGFRSVDGYRFLNGRPVCECCPADVFEPYPAFKGRPTAAQYVKSQRIAATSKAWEWKANGPADAAGSRQFLAPHRGGGPDGGRGGCEHCVSGDGTPVFGADGLPKPRCCTKPTKVFNATQLIWYQDETFGSREWYSDWNVRNRAEGVFGALKNLALVNWGRDYHHFVGQGHEALVAMFAIAVHNMRMIGSWIAEQLKVVRKGGRPAALPGALPSAVPTQLVPNPGAVPFDREAEADLTADIEAATDTGARRPAKRRATPPPPAVKPPTRKQSRGPKGLPGLGADPPGT